MNSHGHRSTISFSICATRALSHSGRRVNSWPARSISLSLSLLSLNSILKVENHYLSPFKFPLANPTSGFKKKDPGGGGPVKKGFLPIAPTIIRV